MKKILLGMILCLLVSGMVSVWGEGFWETRNEGLTSLFIVGLTIDPGNPNRMFATTRGQGVWRSLDGGAGWVKSSTGLPDWGPPYGHLVTKGVVIDASDPNILFAVAAPSTSNPNYGRIYRSLDGGGTWALSTTGASVGGWYGICGITANPKDSSHLYAGTIVTGAGGGIFESTNRGETWVNIAGTNFPDDGDLGNDCWPIVVDPENPLNLYAGSPHDAMLYSRDGGRTWTESNPGGHGSDTSSYFVTLNPARTSEVWIGHTNGSFRSDDAGVTWNNVSALFGGAKLDFMQFAPSNPNVVYALAGWSLYRSTNNGVSFTRILEDTSYARCLAVHPENSALLFLGTWGRGVLRSADGGQTWEMRNAGMPVNSQIDIGYVTAHPTRGGEVFCQLRGNGLYRSENHGQNWEFMHPLKSLYMNSLAINPESPEVMFYTWYDLFRSMDGGSSWEKLLDSSQNGGNYRAAKYDRSWNWLWVVDSHYDDSGSRILFSPNHGETWYPLSAPGNPPLDQYNDIAIDPTDPDVLLVASSPKWTGWMENGWIFRSIDGGESWTRIKEGLELRNWNIVTGQWYVQNDRLVQYNLNISGARTSWKNHTAKDGVYTVRTRIVSTRNDDTRYWAGLLIQAPGPNAFWGDGGVLVGMRRSREVFLWARGETRISILEAVSNASNYQTLGIRAEGNAYTLLINGTEAGTWTDPEGLSAVGYTTLCTNYSRCDFEDFSVTGPPNYSDDFNIGNWGNGYAMSKVVFSPRESGTAYAMDSGSGVYKSTDRGLSWSHLTGSADEVYYFYDLLVSSHPGANVVITKGTFQGTGFVTGVFPYGNTPFHQLGDFVFDYYRASLSQDAVNPNILYGGRYGPGFEVFNGNLPAPAMGGGMWLVR